MGWPRHSLVHGVGALIGVHVAVQHQVHTICVEYVLPDTHEAVHFLVVCVAAGKSTEWMLIASLTEQIYTCVSSFCGIHVAHTP